jgi:hypothetical protein
MLVSDAASPSSVIEMDAGETPELSITLTLGVAV